MKKKIILGVIGVIVLFAVISAIGGSSSSSGSPALKSSENSGDSNNSNSTSSGSVRSNTSVNKPSQDDLMKQNNPDIKHLSTLTADYVGKSFTLYANAETTNYYNYGFRDENSYYSLKLWDSSVNGDFDGVYGYISKADPNSKVLVEKILNGATFLKVHASIPTGKYEQSSNSFLQIDSWEEVK